MERAKARARGDGGSLYASQRESAFTTAELETMRAAGVIRQTFAARIRAGWERAAALSTPPHKMAHPQKHGRYTIPSDTVAAAAARGIQENTLRLRVAMGWPLERAATEPPSATERYLLGGKTAVEVAKEHGVNPDAFYARLGLGWTIERAATEPVRQQVKRTKVPKGAQPTHFVGERPAFEVAEENGIARQLFWARMKVGWSVERAATEPPQDTHTVAGRPAVEVAEEHGITSAAFYSRIKYGWTAERAATEPMRSRAQGGGGSAPPAPPATPRGG